METSDITVAILRDIRDEIRGVRGEQERMRLEQEGMRTEMATTGSSILALANQLGSIRELLEGRRDLKKRVSRCEREIVAIKQRLP